MNEGTEVIIRIEFALIGFWIGIWFYWWLTKDDNTNKHEKVN